MLKEGGTRGAGVQDKGCGIGGGWCGIRGRGGGSGGWRERG